MLACVELPHRHPCVVCICVCVCVCVCVCGVCVCVVVFYVHMWLCVYICVFGVGKGRKYQKSIPIHVLVCGRALISLH